MYLILYVVNGRTSSSLLFFCLDFLINLPLLSLIMEEEINFLINLPLFFSLTLEEEIKDERNKYIIELQTI